MSMPAHTAEPAVDPDVEVLRLLAAGCSSTEIAARLGLGPSTVKKRVERVYGRIGCQSRANQAAEYVAQHGHELPTTHTPALTERQHQVLAMISEGHTNTAIAAALGISESSAKTHTSNLYARIGARNRAQATRYAMNLQNTDPARIGTTADI
jgi:DNA-binding NarL/FixJ family response regulator